MLFSFTLHATQVDLQVKWNDNFKTTLPSQGRITGRKKKQLLIATVNMPFISS